jgi:hypothetical protein
MPWLKKTSRLAGESCAIDAMARHACSLSSGSLDASSDVKYLTRTSPVRLSVPVAYLRWGQEGRCRTEEAATGATGEVGGGARRTG